MDERVQPKPEIYVHCQNGKISGLNLAGYWDTLPLDNWLDYTYGPIYIRPARRWLSNIVKLTAGSLVDHINHKRGEISAILLEDGNLPDYSGFGISEPGSHVDSSRLYIRSGCMRDGVPVDRKWILPFSLITVCGAGPDNSSFVSSILDAQAELINLPSHLERAMRFETAFEAHRLLRSDIAIICGPTTFSAPEDYATLFWAASNDDISLEAFFSRSAGVDVFQMPVFKTLMQHEIINPDNYEINGDIPRICGYRAAGLIVFLNSILEGISTFFALMYDEGLRLAQNYDRIVKAVFKLLKGGGKQK